MARNDSRGSDISEGHGGTCGPSSMPVKRTPIPSVNHVKLMQTTSDQSSSIPGDHQPDSHEFSGPANVKSMNDSARDYNQAYLDQVISPTSTRSRMISSLHSFTDTDEKMQEKRSTENTSGQRVPSKVTNARKDTTTYESKPKADGPEIMINDQGPPETPPKKYKRTS